METSASGHPLIFSATGGRGASVKLHEDAAGYVLTWDHDTRQRVYAFRVGALSDAVADAIKATGALAVTWHNGYGPRPVPDIVRHFEKEEAAPEMIDVGGAAWAAAALGRPDLARDTSLDAHTCHGLPDLIDGCQACADNERAKRVSEGFGGTQ